MKFGGKRSRNGRCGMGIVCAGNGSSLGTARMRSEDRIGIRLINMEKCSLSAGK